MRGMNSMEGRLRGSDLVVGIAIGFALSGAFYAIWGAFQLVGFFLWSIVGGGGGALAGRLLTGRLWGAIAGALAVRLAIFVFFGGVLL